MTNPTKTGDQIMTNPNPNPTVREWIARHFPDHPIAADPTPAIPDRVWINQEGTTACGKHGGTYLMAAIARNPQAMTHQTPLDNWLAVPTSEAIEADACCERCGSFGD